MALHQYWRALHVKISDKMGALNSYFQVRSLPDENNCLSEQNTNTFTPALRNEVEIKVPILHRIFARSFRTAR